ncbi:hypothetical protein 7F15_56 [uncultured Caudovirales phage]|uniref:Uncharacterized protein n=1 Tax=uncultured Caudovirales phage TaxID=2100421 RepID=A0A2H4J2V2_9CAUD|nr:hypothetical protein 7F15_56 [uncultured Caudovirales phage]
MAYEYDMKNLIAKLSGVWVESEKKEILKELQEVYRKAKAYDKLVELYPQKDEIPSDEFFMMMGYIIKERADDER